MILNSFAFLVFFIVVFILFWKIPSRFQWIWLLISGYYFYGSYKPAYLGIILLTTLVNYYCAIKIHTRPRYKGRYLLFALFLDIGALFIFKYFNFFSLTINGICRMNIPQFKLLLPLGISFYTLQVTGYLLDVYKGKIPPERHFGFFSLFVCFFPLLSAGPIERSTTLLPQLKKKHTFNYIQMTDGVKLFAFGLFKKMVIADNLGIIVDRVFGSLTEYKGMSLILTVFFYSWQIYMDFSGYTDMARGSAKMVGINLMENFNLPYFADSIQDFWRRWHISLSSWLRDYIYIPLGGNRKGIGRTILNNIIVFGVSGLWHGASWNFVIWGLLHGFVTSLERVGKKIVRTPIPVPGILKILSTYFFISMFWVFFRATTLKDALYVLKNSFVGVRNFVSLNYVEASLSQLFVFNRTEIMITCALLSIAVFLEIIQKKESFFHLLSKQPIYVRYFVYILMVFMIIQLRNAQIKEFIYIRF
ncbi:hypothetical protein A2Y99_05260 [Candidatus Gottesmanbacteria bacterium RBG_13_37_7]|uniref:Alginate O-acetyltransferase n=1 Tax=Candidatus Gottesmanbacteria bacterium RBG_13_37_7 TaxID=1798369 RepID=A0A1F5YK90_9BACT|nr:MAG: hypothetical protein A2Y99_05260 [Candidatus Gottesmanbacteria bacterium RBG_13_37_7]